MNIEKIENHTIIFKKIFLFTFSTGLLIRLIGAYSLLPSKIDTLFFTLVSLLGLMLLFTDFFILKKISIKKNILLILFILALLLSAIVNGPSGLIANFKLIIWQIIYLFVVFQVGYTVELHESINTLEKIIIISWNILTILSILMFFGHFSYVAPLDKFYNGLRIGFVENRLYGVFADPNFAGTVSVAVLLLSVYYILSKKNFLFIKVTSIISLPIQFIYIVLSGSRTALISLVVVAFFGTLFFAYHRGKRKISSYGISFLLGLIAVLFVFGGEWAIKYSLPKMAQNTPVVFSIKTNSAKHHDKKTDVTLARADVDQKDDVSNNRFELWKSSFEIFKSTPLVGTSPRNLMDYAEKKLPSTFIATKKQTSHNFIFYLLATTGVLGTLPILLFILIKIFIALRVLIISKENSYNRFLLDTLVCLAILVSACFLTELVLVNKIGTFLFWLYLGKVALFSDEFLKKRDVIYETTKR
ncbi:O-antigen ligase family protein [Enterococcus viikkiensis]|uniref:O-antigen ligase family protein n=1 Tax=Enterococcus viikkiensis TaxID=930854 RepID=A0ABU3FNK7_9ENTE|nr:O-antigen ligase family protein [Enterococcus viikkiensis]MDT2827538.1 O-antigen ligase family protein [Enterococcus viikkiensis]